jgi:hypothetical protein
MTARQGKKRWIALGTTLGVVAAWGGFGLVGAATTAPTTITTCTKASNGKTKVIAPATVAKCTKKGKGVAKTWNTVNVAALNAQIATLTSNVATAKVEACNTLGAIAANPTVFAAVIAQTEDPPLLDPVLNAAINALGSRCFNP